MGIVSDVNVLLALALVPLRSLSSRWASCSSRSAQGRRSVPSSSRLGGTSLFFLPSPLSVQTPKLKPDTTMQMPAFLHSSSLLCATHSRPSSAPLSHLVSPPLTLRTSRCQYGVRCKFHHPMDKLAGNLAAINLLGMGLAFPGQGQGMQPGTDFTPLTHCGPDLHPSHSPRSAPLERGARLLLNRLLPSVPYSRLDVFLLWSFGSPFHPT